MIDRELPAARLATRLAFFVAGFGIACWRAARPFAKARLAVNDAELGILLLCIGIGGVIAMVASGPISARYGSRPVIIAGGYAMAAILPLLAILPTPITLGLALLAFGAALGLLDVAMNVHAVEVERAEVARSCRLPSMFSIGGFSFESVSRACSRCRSQPGPGLSLAAVDGGRNLRGGSKAAQHHSVEGRPSVRAATRRRRALGVARGRDFLVEAPCWTGAPC